MCMDRIPARIYIPDDSGVVVVWERSRGAVDGDGRSSWGEPTNSGGRVIVVGSASFKDGGVERCVAMGGVVIIYIIGIRVAVCFGVGIMRPLDALVGTLRGCWAGYDCAG